MIENEKLSKRRLVEGIRDNLFEQINKLVEEAEAELKSISHGGED